MAKATSLTKNRVPLEWGELTGEDYSGSTRIRSLFFVSLEGIFRQLHLESHIVTNEQSEDEFRKLVLGSEEIQRHWDGLSQNMENETEALQLLDEIVAMWIAMRGFSKTSARLEQYKDKRKTVKKSKGLRKSLQQ